MTPIREKHGAQSEDIEDEARARESRKSDGKKYLEVLGIGNPPTKTLMIAKR